MASAQVEAVQLRLVALSLVLRDDLTRQHNDFSSSSVFEIERVHDSSHDIDVAGAAIGVASLGIQVCQGLLDYYRACDNYDSDVQEAQQWISRLLRTLVILGDTLQCTNSKQDVFQNAQTCILNCDEGIRKLEKKLRKFRKDQPTTTGEKTKALSRRLVYPFQQSTVAKLKEIVRDLFDQVLLAVHVVQVESDVNTQNVALRIDDTVNSISASTTGLELTARSQQAQLVQLLGDVEGLHIGNLAIKKELSGLPGLITQTVAGLLSASQLGQIARSGQLVLDVDKSQLFDILNWLEAPDHSAFHLRQREAWAPGTCQWLLDTLKFKAWLFQGNQWLWLTGRGGCGKTVLCSQVIEYVADRARHRKAEMHVYCYFRASIAGPHSQPYEQLLLSMIVQLIDRQSAILPELRTAFVQKDRGVALLEDIVMQLIQPHDTVYVMIDGLDEIQHERHGQDVFRGLCRMLDRTSAVRVFVTSRFMPYWGAADLQPLTCVDIMEVLQINSASVDTDISIFIARRLDQYTRLKTLTTATKQSLVDNLGARSHHSFVWCALVLNQLLSTSVVATSASIEKAFAPVLSLPTKLEDLYASQFSGIDTFNRESALRILQWMAFALRPLTARELFETLSPDLVSLSRDVEDEAGEILRIFSFGLVKVSDATTDRLDFAYHDSKSPIVLFFHKSAREFVIRTGLQYLTPPSESVSYSPAAAHARLARRCMAYLRWHLSERMNNKSQSADSFPFLAYASQHWRDHLDLALDGDLLDTQEREELRHQAELLDNETDISQARTVSLSRNSRTLTFGPLTPIPLLDRDGRRPANPSLSSIAQGKLLEISPQLAADFTTPLQQACSKGKTKLVCRLLERGADVNACSGQFCSALHVAAYYGHIDTVKILLEAKANVDLEGGRFGTALQAAITADHDEIVELLLEHGADVNIGSERASLLGPKQGSSSVDQEMEHHKVPFRRIQRVMTEED